MSKTTVDVTDALMHTNPAIDSLQFSLPCFIEVLNITHTRERERGPLYSKYW
jgi:hypothetical protein